MSTGPIRLLAYQSFTRNYTKNGCLWQACDHGLNGICHEGAEKLLGIPASSTLSGFAVYVLDTAIPGITLPVHQSMYYYGGSGSLGMYLIPLSCGISSPPGAMCFSVDFERASTIRSYVGWNDLHITAAHDGWEFPFLPALPKGLVKPTAECAFQWPISVPGAILNEYEFATNRRAITTAEFELFEDTYEALHDKDDDLDSVCHSGLSEVFQLELPDWEDEDEYVRKYQRIRFALYAQPMPYCVELRHGDHSEPAIFDIMSRITLESPSWDFGCVRDSMLSKYNTLYLTCRVVSGR